MTATPPSDTRSPDYLAPAWLPGPHLQTIYPALLAPRALVTYRRERWDTPDGDFVDVDVCAEGPNMLVLFHGLEGCSRSHYALAMSAAAARAGWGAAVIHFRGCSGEMNLAPRAYHSGDSDEIDWMLARAAARWPSSRRFALGVSLGGNALLKWAGERGTEAGRRIEAAAALSAPLDLEAGARSLSRGFNRLYTRNFLRTLKRKSLLKLDQHPGLFDRDRMLSAADFFDFDDAVTAPMHGFESCFDYWRRSSSGPFLRSVELPTLVVNARNDPFLPAAALPGPQAAGPGVQLLQPPTGGHVGFVDRRWPGRFTTFADLLLRWFEAGPARLGPVVSERLDALVPGGPRAPA